MVQNRTDWGQFEALLEAAHGKRSRLQTATDTNAYRLVNGAGDDLEGLTVDRFAETLVVSLYNTDLEPQLLESIAKVFAPQSIYLKRRPKEARVVASTHRSELAPLGAVWGLQTPEVAILEAGRRFLIRPGGDLSVGLFLDMRQTRNWLQQNIGSGSLLNCFAYTCGFGVAAALGGAGRVVNLDLSKKVLQWGQENYHLNSLEPHSIDFISGDSFEWFERFARRSDRFSAIILDPPSFATSRHSRFSAVSNYDQLVAQAVHLLEPGGLLLACCNHSKLSRLHFKKAIARGLEGSRRGYNLLKSLGQSNTDFPVLPTAEAPLKVFALEVL